MTGLFDATDLATCRMYHGATETWQGLGKNAIEGLASPRLIGIMTVMMCCGQILPWVVLPFASGLAFTLALAATGISLAPRIGNAVLFRQSTFGVALHPISVILLLLIQWQAFFKWMFGMTSSWKGRSYGTVAKQTPAPTRPITTAGVRT
jgi:hypothetical protein